MKTMIKLEFTFHTNSTKFDICESDYHKITIGQNSNILLNIVII